MFQCMLALIGRLCQVKALAKSCLSSAVVCLLWHASYVMECMLWYAYIRLLASCKGQVMTASGARGRDW